MNNKIMQVLICMNNKIKMVLIERATVLFSYKIVQGGEYLQNTLPLLTTIFFLVGTLQRDPKIMILDVTRTLV